MCCVSARARSQMLEQGFSADSADYDGRTALMLSAGKGHAGAAAAPCH